MFEFGDNKMIKSFLKKTISFNICSYLSKNYHWCCKKNIPLLLSKESMKKANTKIDFWQDKISIFGKIVDITCTSIGHYCIKVDNKFQWWKSF